MKVCKSVMIKKKKIMIRLRRSNEAKAERLLTAVAKFQNRAARTEDLRSRPQIIFGKILYSSVFDVQKANELSDAPPPPTTTTNPPAE